jgi:hypothetical protein
MTIVEPIHIATINGKPLRFFLSPHDDAAEPFEFPWCSVGDLLSCLDVPSDQQSLFLQWVAERTTSLGPQGEGRVIKTQTVATADGIVTIAPKSFVNPIVTGFTDEESRHQISTDLLYAYYDAADEAINKITEGVDPCERRSWMKLAGVFYMQELINWQDKSMSPSPATPSGGQLIVLRGGVSPGAH